MPPGNSESVLVTMRKACGKDLASATVKMSVAPGQAGSEPRFSNEYTKRESPLSMGPECAALYKSLDDLRIACELAVLAAIDHFQKLYPNPLDWTIEVIEGSNLAQDGTLGFYLAATRAAVRVTGFSSGIESDVHGWEEVS